MKKLIVAMTVAALAGSAVAGQQKACAVTIAAPVTYVTVEEFHVVDVCMPAGESFEQIALGDSNRWRFESQDGNTRMLIKPIDARIRSNAIIYVKDAPEKRYELRLFATNKVTE